MSRLAGFADAAVGGTFNLGSGSEVSVRDLAALVADVLGRSRAPVTAEQARPGDVLRLCAGTSQLRRALGFEPSVSLREGLARLRDWYASLERSPEALLETEVVRNWEPETRG